MQSTSESEKPQIPLSPLKSNRILCQLWLTEKFDSKKSVVRPKFLGNSKVKFGESSFSVKGIKGSYKIVYEELKEGKDCFIFDCDVDNAIGSLNFYDRSEKKVAPYQAELMIGNDTVKVFKRKENIYRTLLIILAVGLVAFAVAMPAIVTWTISTQQTNAILKTQVESLQTQLNPPKSNTVTAP